MRYLSTFLSYNGLTATTPKTTFHNNRVCSFHLQLIRLIIGFVLQYSAMWIYKALITTSTIRVYININESCLSYSQYTNYPILIILMQKQGTTSAWPLTISTYCDFISWCNISRGVELSCSVKICYLCGMKGSNQLISTFTG